mmetsp:Transcript_12807/g.12713  ORF Transcript_12807/g.12713 Transcript_12807/m.12713 type:complete len:162 (-) Transcript_12807:384-869(-)
MSYVIGANVACVSEFRFIIKPVETPIIVLRESRNMASIVAHFSLLLLVNWDVLQVLVHQELLGLIVNSFSISLCLVISLYHLGILALGQVVVCLERSHQNFLHILESSFICGVFFFRMFELCIQVLLIVIIGIYKAQVLFNLLLQLLQDRVLLFILLELLD